jgi:hypothetical protein
MVNHLINDQTELHGITRQAQVLFVDLGDAYFFQQAMRTIFGSGTLETEHGVPPTQILSRHQSGFPTGAR